MRVFPISLLLISVCSATDEELQEESRTHNTARRIDEIAPRIIGGQDAVNGRFPYGQISLRDAAGQHQCGGSLIADDVVLTAGHCHGFARTVHIGVYDVNNPFDRGEVFSPVEARRHPSYKAAQFRYDFAVIQLDRPVANASIIKLNDDPNIPVEGDALIVMGFGADQRNAKRNPRYEYPDVFQVGEVDYMSNPTCRVQEFNGQTLYQDAIFSEMMCAGSPGVDACSGDSGSALIIEGKIPEEDVQVGIVSWGRGCAIYPGVYSRIDVELKWIQFNACDLASNPPNSLRCDQFTVPPTAAPVADSEQAVEPANGRTNADTTTNTQASSPTSRSQQLLSRMYWFGLGGIALAWLFV